MPTIYQVPQSPKQTAKKPDSSKVSAPVMQTTRVGPLTSYATNPEHIRFETQQDNEHVILFLRQHIIVTLPWIVITLIALFAPTVIFPLFVQSLHIPDLVPPTYLLIGMLFWYLAVFGFALASFVGWFFNIFIVTDQRAIDIDFHYLLYKQISEAELTRIQDITYTTGGVIATLFDYGTVLVETAGEFPNIEFENVPHPARIIEIIRGLTEGTKISV